MRDEDRQFCPKVSRRQFSKILLATAAASALPVGKGRAAEAVASSPEAKVFLQGLAKDAPDSAIISAVKEAALAATDFSWLKKGDRVLIKPVCNSPNKYPATTNPAGLKAMAMLLKERGAGRVIVSDMSGVQYVNLKPDGLRGSTRKLMQDNGLFQAAQAGGADLFFPEEQGWSAFFEDGPVSGSHWKAGIMIPKILKEVDHIVLMPRTARHMVVGTTLGMKAVVGYMRHDSRLEYHRDAATLYEKTAEANTVPCLKNKLRLVLTTATKTLTTMGPDNGYINTPETGLIIASDSLVAHDMASLAWLIVNREQTPEPEKKGMKDPFPERNSLLNSGVVLILGGVGEVARTEKMPSFILNSIWDEPVLKHYFKISGQVPMVKMVDTANTVPVKLMNKLSKMVVKQA